MTLDLERVARIVVLLAGLGALVIIGARVVDQLSAEVARP